LNILSGNPGFFSDKKVIDLGCGEGRDSLYLSSLGIDIVGVDISHSALNKARELARMDNIKAKFVETNVLYLNDIPDNYFDTAINMGCLHMIVNEEERISHLKNVYRILKPGGIFIIDHCQENWGKGFFSLPGELYNKDKLVVGNVIERRIRTAHGEMNIPLEVIPYSEMKADALTDEVCSTGFESKFVILSDTEAFGNSALIVFQKAS
jgi:ubiquinone/menaquinone biosynthesis C-methylase UbiE